MAPEEREEEQAEQGFTISDKRLFTAEGERRVGEDRPEPERTPPPPPRQETPPVQEPQTDAERAYAQSEGETASQQEMPPADFGTYVVMLANTVMMLLGQVPDPMTQQRRLDLPQAKHTIDILMMLRDKTQGNVTADEAQLLEEVLPQLQMAYVSVSRQAG